MKYKICNRTKLCLFGVHPLGCQALPNTLKRGQQTRAGSAVCTLDAFSLVEMIGVMAVVCILALALIPILIKQMDYAAGQKEIGQLKAFADAFRLGVLKTKIIPNQTGWDTIVATNLGLSVSQVRTNDRNQARVFLIDPAYQVGASVAGQSYVQTNTGAANLPVNPRLMILSSISPPLPGSLTNGVGLSSGPYAFNNIWDSSEGSIPAGWTWTGKGDDLKVQRLNLNDLFIQLVLNNADTNATPGRYLMDGVGPNTVPNPNLSAYFIDGTVLGLVSCGSTPVLQYSEILHAPKSFDFILCTWKAEKFLGRTIQHPTPLDLQTAADAFLSSSNNPDTKFGTTRSDVYNAMILYLNDYVLWASSSPAFNNSYGTPTSSAQTDLANKSGYLINP